MGDGLRLEYGELPLPFWASLTVTSEPQNRRETYAALLKEISIYTSHLRHAALLEKRVAGQLYMSRLLLAMPVFFLGFFQIPASCSDRIAFSLFLSFDLFF